MEREERNLRVAILGYGLAGSVFHAPLVSNTSGMEVSALVTSNAERQEQVRQQYPEATIYSQAEALWRDAAHYDLAVIATANQAHVPLALQALEAGLSVVVDKPLAANVLDAERLIAKSKQTGKLLSVFQNRRWDNDFLTVRRLLADDLLGPITRFESRFERYRPVPKQGSWKENADPAHAGGVLFDLGSHLIDQALQLFGRPVSVYAEVERRRPGVQVEDDAFIALRFGQGIHALLWTSLVTALPGPRFRLNGLRGTYEKWGLDPQEDALRRGERPGNLGWGQETREHWGRMVATVKGNQVDEQIETLPGAYERYYTLLRDALLTGAPNPVEPAEALVALRVIEVAKKSANEGRVIPLFEQE